MKRLTLTGVALGFLVGCHGDDDENGSPTGTTGPLEFRETFSGEFPGDDWIVEEGDPAVVMDDEGSDGPGLVFGPSLDDVHVRTAFTFTTTEALDLSLDLAAPPQVEPEPSLFRFQIVGEGIAVETASADVAPAEGVIRLSIQGDSETMVFPTNGEFHRIGFAVDEFGIATWFVDGLPAMTRASFPERSFRLVLEARAETATGFVVDNVVLSR
jgi:hypothetical protein